MAKQNVKLNSLGTLDQFSAKDFDSGAAEIYAWANTSYQCTSAWYWTSIRHKRVAALSMRAATVLLVIAATVLQTLSAIESADKDKLALSQAVLCVLALAGLLQLADKVFGFSTGWGRYVSTATAIEVATRAFTRQWRGALLQSGGALTLAALFELAKTYEEALLALQSAETQAWVAEFSQGTQLLNDAISRMRVENGTTLQAAVTALAVRAGMIQLTFKQAKQTGPLKLSIEDGPLVDVEASFAARMNAGVYHGVVKAASDTGPGTRFGFAVAADAVTLLTIELP